MTTNPEQSPDALDARLAASAQSSPTDDTTLLSSITLMIEDARVEATGGRRRRVGVRAAVVGALAAVIVAGGGVAVASSLIDWSPEYANPDTTFTVTLPSGRLCEARYVAEATYPDGGPEVPRGVPELQAWLSAQDFTTVDLTDGAAQVAEWDERSPDQTVVIGPDGWLMDVPEPPSTRTADDTYAFILSQSVKAEIVRGIGQLGLDVRDAWSVIGDVKCELVTR